MKSEKEREMDNTLYRRQVLCLDSGDREDRDNTTPAKYTIKFRVVKSVKLVRLLSCEIPNSAYVFDTNNNKLDFAIDVASGGLVPPGTYTAVITPGTYTSTELANEITLRMNEVVNTQFGITFVATYITYRQKLQIDRVDGPGKNFQLLWATGPNKTSNCYAQLGFALADTPAMTASILSDNVLQLSGDNYIYMCVKQFPSTRTTHNIEDVFAKIILSVPPRSIVFDSFASAEQVYDQPIDLRQLEIVFRRPDGSLVDFQTIDHSFTLEIYTTN